MHTTVAWMVFFCMLHRDITRPDRSVRCWMDSCNTHTHTNKVHFLVIIYY